MNSFDKVTRDLFNAIDKIEYSDMDDKNCQTQIMLTLYQMLRSKDTYREALSCLQKHESDKRSAKTLMFENKMGL